MDTSTERIALLDQRLLSQLAELQSMIGDSAQPWASVSPLFTNLAATWTSLQVGGLMFVMLVGGMQTTQRELELCYETVFKPVFRKRFPFLSSIKLVKNFSPTEE